jgi:hypothetical protein
MFGFPLSAEGELRSVTALPRLDLNEFGDLRHRSQVAPDGSR